MLILSKKISRLINIDDDEGLGYTSDVLITKNKDKILELIKLLKSEYTINDIAEFHKIIASIKFFVSSSAFSIFFTFK